jgi:hypothetical protein
MRLHRPRPARRADPQRPTPVDLRITLVDVAESSATVVLPKRRGIRNTSGSRCVQVRSAQGWADMPPTGRNPKSLRLRHEPPLDIREQNANRLSANESQFRDAAAGQGPTESSSAIKLATAMAADTPPGHAAHATRPCTGRHSTVTAQRWKVWRCGSRLTVPSP